MGREFCHIAALDARLLGGMRDADSKSNVVVDGMETEVD